MLVVDAPSAQRPTDRALNHRKSCDYSRATTVEVEKCVVTGKLLSRACPPNASMAKTPREPEGLHDAKMSVWSTLHCIDIALLVAMKVDSTAVPTSCLSISSLSVILWKCLALLHSTPSMSIST